MKCIIVDDDQISRQSLQKLCDQIGFIQIIASFSNPVEALQFVGANKVDLIFLDIHMPNLTGIDLVRSVQTLPQIIFTTSDEQFALEAFEYAVTDYIIKPVALPRLLKAVQKAKLVYDSDTSSESNKPLSGSVFVKVNSKLVKLKLDDILWIEATGDYVNIKTITKAYTVLSTMKNIENRLPGNTFVKVHRSYIVNIHRIKDIDDSTLVIENKVIPISRSNRDSLMKKINLL